MKNLKKLVLFLTVGVILSSVLFSTVGPLLGSVAADAPGSGANTSGGGTTSASGDYTPPDFGLAQTIQTNLHARQEYLWISACFNHLDMDKVSYGSEMTGWGYFIGAHSGFTDDNQPEGHEVLIGNTEGADDAAIEHCDTGSNVSTALNLLGFNNPTSFFCHIPGAKFNDVNSSGDGGGHGNNGTFDQSNAQDMTTCELNKEHHDWDNDSVSQDDVYNGFKKLIATTAVGKAAMSETAALDYLRNYQVFQNECDPSYISDYDGTAGNNPTYYKWPIVTPDGQIKYVLVYGDDDGKAVAMHGAGTTSWKGDSQTGYGTTSTCGGVAVQARSDAAAYAAYVKANPKDIQTQSPGSTDDGSGAQEASCFTSGASLAWLMCELLDGLQATAGYLYENMVVPLLTVPPLSSKDAGGIQLHHAWSSIRIYGNVFLVIALLVIVIGESVGGGLIDAYTAKKVIPRILIAGILINISYYVCAFAVDVSNIVGQGLRDLLVQGFGLQGGFSRLEFGNGDTAVDLLAGATGLVAFVFLKHGITGAISSFIEFILFTVLTTGVMIFLAIVATLVLRLALLYLLIALSPVAFACWILPNTEKYFQKWWQIFQELLLMYPLISAMFAISVVLAHSSLWTTMAGSAGGDGVVGGAIAPIISVIALLLPLAMIPFAFKIAGGVLGQLHGFIDGQRSKASNAVQQKLDSKYGLRARRAHARERTVADKRAYSYNRAMQSKPGLLRTARLGGEFLMGSRTAQLRQAANNKEDAEDTGVVTGFGDDTLRRARTINKDSLMGTARHRVVDGQNEFMTTTGNWYNEATVDQAHKVIHSNGEVLAAFSYQLGKTVNEAPDRQEEVLSDFAAYAQEAGLDEKDASGQWSGIGIQNQRMRNDLRQADIKKRDDGTFVGVKKSAAHLDAMGTETGFSLSSQQEGNFDSMVEAVDSQMADLNRLDTSIATNQAEIANPNTNTERRAALQADITRDTDTRNRTSDRLVNAYGNLEKFLGAGSTGGTPEMGPDGVATGAMMGGASSASYKTEEAARKARDTIKAKHGDLRTAIPKRDYSGGNDSGVYSSTNGPAERK